MQYDASSSLCCIGQKARKLEQYAKRGKEDQEGHLRLWTAGAPEAPERGRAGSLDPRSLPGRSLIREFVQYRRSGMPQGPELLIILVVVVLLFGGAKLPKLARSLGQAQNEFKAGLKEGTDKSTDEEGSEA